MPLQSIHIYSGAQATQSWRNHFDLTTMPEALQRIEQTLQRLGVGNNEQVSALFAEVREQFNELEAHRREENDPVNLQNFWTTWLGRKSGVLTKIAENWLKPSPPELKRIVGQELNFAESAYSKRYARTDRCHADCGRRYCARARDREDPSLPGVIRPLGTRHPLRLTFEEIEGIFLSLGYSVVAGPEMETPYYTFEALNIPEHHPARDNMDTFYMSKPPGASPLLLRTQTSPMQIRENYVKACSRRCGSSCREKCTGATIRTPRTDSCSIRSRASLSTHDACRSAILLRRWNIFVREFLGPNIKNVFAPQLFPVHRVQALKWMRRACFAAARAVMCANSPDGSNCSARAWSIRSCTVAANYDVKQLSGIQFGRLRRNA